MSKVLVAEDDRTTRLMVNRSLEKEGYDVIEARDGGAAMTDMLQEVQQTVDACAGSAVAELAVIHSALGSALAQARLSTARILVQYRDNREAALAGAFDYLMQLGYLMGGWHLARSALAVQQHLANGNPFYPRKVQTACYYMEQILPRSISHDRLSWLLQAQKSVA